MRENLRAPDSSADIVRARFALAALVAGALIALGLVAVFFSGAKTDFEDAAALGAETTSLFARVDGHPIHCMDNRDLAPCMAGARARGAGSAALWLGNSQVHAVNQWREGETNAPPILFEALSKRGLDLLTLSQPNANLQEHYVLFEYLSQRLPLRVLVLPVVFDDMREGGMREGIAVLAREQSTSVALSRTGVGRNLVATAKALPQDEETAGIARTMQERAERVLNAWLEENVAPWQARPEMRGQILLGLYQLRNFLFGIKATSKRKQIPARYQENWAALNAILSSAASRDISVLLYVAPLRGGVETPYVEAEYARFKSDVETLAKRHGVIYANLESLVPDDTWGAKDATTLGGAAELDFMHFQAGGHRLLAERLDSLIAEVMLQRADGQ